MPLSAGTRLGPYEIVAPLGAGGMGEVYRARDAKLNRDVALKILPDTFAADIDRISRFRREAQVLASLNHPNIGQIYGLEDTTTPHALVLELIEGPTLADRIAQGPIPIGEALPLARQIAEALEAAHEHGVVHRDLKPANIKVRPDDTVKVLDFGLAKAFDPAAVSHEALNSPTLTVRATQLGVVLGTAAYMSPEQARGKVVDRRADIWAFGAVLYEMLSGMRAFEGEDVSDTLAAVLRQDVKWHALPASTPPAVVRLLMRCLERDVRKRLRDIGEARVLLEDSATSAEPHAPVRDVPPPSDRHPLWKRAAPIAGTAIMVGLLAGSAGWYFRPSPASGVVTRFRHSLPDGVTFSSPTRHVLNISRDGTQIVYVANNRLYIRKISESEGQPVQGSDGLGPNQPAFSPDGRSVAFWTAFDSTIKRIPAAGGPAVTVCQSDNPYGVSWDESGIIFGQGDRGTIMRAPPNGGTPETLVTARTGEIPSGPQMLPDGKHLLFAVTTDTFIDRWDKAQIVVQSLASGERKTIIAAGADARYLPTGHITYAVAGVLFIAPFDLSRLETTGSSAPVIEGVRRGLPMSATGSAQYAISNSGTLVYLPGPVSPGGGSLDIALIDRNGTVKALGFPPGSYASPRVSPDGTSLAFDVAAARDAFIATYDLAGKTAMRPLTIGGTNRFPIWTSDSKRIVYQSDREGDRGLFWQRADGNGPAERLTRANGGEEHIPESWSPASSVLLVSIRKGSEYTLWSLSIPDKTLARFGSIRANGMPLNATFSPDGRWVAYQSNVEVRITVYVEPVPLTGAVYALLPRGADVPHEPQWSPDGKELFYNPRAGGFEVVSVTTAPAFAFGNPVALPRPFQLSPPQGRRSYDITPNGKLVALTLPSGDLMGSQIEVVLNWFDELKRRVAAQ